MLKLVAVPCDVTTDIACPSQAPYTGKKHDKVSSVSEQRGILDGKTVISLHELKIHVPHVA